MRPAKEVEYTLMWFVELRKNASILWIYNSPNEYLPFWFGDKFPYILFWFYYLVSKPRIQKKFMDIRHHLASTRLGRQWCRYYSKWSPNSSTLSRKGCSTHNHRWPRSLLWTQKWCRRQLFRRLGHLLGRRSRSPVGRRWRSYRNLKSARQESKAKR